MLKELQTKDKEITYDKLMMLFLFGGIAGVILEGTFCYITKGHWESHVVTVVGTFNTLYGVGAMLFYVGAVKLKSKSMPYKVAVMTFSTTGLELLSGLLLRYGLGMRAWDYSNSFMNYKGIICVGFTCIWGLVAYVFCKLQPRISKSLEKVEGKKWHIAFVIFGVFMVLNLTLTAMYITRWSERHYGFSAQSKIQSTIDKDAPDDWMQSRFVEWEFLDTIKDKVNK